MSMYTYSVASLTKKCHISVQEWSIDLVPSVTKVKYYSFTTLGLSRKNGTTCVRGELEKTSGYKSL